MESRKRSDDPSKVSSRAPFGVVVAEVFLVFILMIYFAKLGVLMMGLLSEDASDQLDLLGWNFVFYFVEIALFFLSLIGLFGLSSRRPSGWRNAARATVILLFMTVWGTLFGRTMSLTSIVTFRLDQVIPLVVVVLVAVMLPSVRRWYIPPMMEPRPLSAWVRYMISGSLYPKGAYRISYPEPREETIEVGPESAGLFGFIGSFVRRLRPWRTGHRAMGRAAPCSIAPASVRCGYVPLMLCRIMESDRYAPGDDLKDQIAAHRGLRGEKCPYVRSPDPYPDFRSFDQAQLSYYLYVREALIHGEPVKSDEGYSWLLVVELINDRRDPPETLRLLTKLYTACCDHVEGYAFLPVPSVLFEYAAANDLELPRVFNVGIWEEALRSELLYPTPDDLSYQAVGLLVGRPVMAHYYLPEESEAARLFNAALPAVDDRLRRTQKGGIMDIYGTGEQAVGVELFDSLPYFYDRGCTLTYIGSDDRLNGFLAAMYAYCHRLLEGNAGRNARPVPRVFDKDLRKVVDSVYNDGAIVERLPCTKADRGTARRFSEGTDDPTLVRTEVSRYVLSSMFHPDLGRYRDREPDGPCPYVPSGSDNPDFRHMSKGAIQYYLQWRNRTREGRYGQTDDGYLWLYECELINDDRGSGYVLDRLAGLARAYDRFFDGTRFGSSIRPGRVYYNYAFLECPRIPDPTVYPCDIGACDMIDAVLDGEEVPVSSEIFMVAMGAGNITSADQNLRASFTDDCAVLTARILTGLNCTDERIGIIRGNCGLDLIRVRREVFTGLRYYGMPGKRKPIHERTVLDVTDNRFFRRELRSLARAVARALGSGKIRGNTWFFGMDASAVIREELDRFSTERAADAAAEEARSIVIDMGDVSRAEEDLRHVTELVGTDHEEDAVSDAVDPLQEASDDPWIDLVFRLDEDQREYLRKALGGTLRTMKATTEGAINAIAMETVKDAVLEDGVPYDEYVPELSRVLGRQ